MCQCCVEREAIRTTTKDRQRKAKKIISTTARDGGEVRSIPCPVPIDVFLTTTAGLSEIRDPSTLGLVASLEPPHHRVLSATLGPGTQMVESPPCLRAQSEALDSTVLDSTFLGSAASLVVILVHSS